MDLTSLKEYIAQLVTKELLSERKKTKGAEPVIAYHGTSSRHLTSILQKGMESNPEKKVWDEDPWAGPNQVSRISLKGTYWTTNLMTAYGSAGRSVDKFKGDRIIVIAQLVLRSTYADEDSIISSIQNSMMMAMVKQFGAINEERFPYYMGAMDEDPSLKSEIVKDFAAKVHDKLKGSETHPISNSLMKDLFEAAFMRTASYAFKSNSARAKYSYVDGRDRFFQGSDYNSHSEQMKNWEPDAKMKDTTSWEYEFSNLLEKMTRQYRKTATDTTDFMHTFRVNMNVGTTGKNRILAIVSVGIGKNPKVLYGNVPDKFLNDYRENISRDAILEDKRTRKIAEFNAIGMGAGGMVSTGAIAGAPVNPKNKKKVAKES